MTRNDMIKYADPGKYYIVSFLVEETGTVIDYVYGEYEKEKAEEHAIELKEKHREKYVSLMECNFKSL